MPNEDRNHPSAKLELIPPYRAPLLDRLGWLLMLGVILLAALPLIAGCRAPSCGPKPPREPCPIIDRFPEPQP